MTRSNALQDFQRIPGVGIKIAQDLFDLGYRNISNLKGQDPQLMYERLCEIQKTTVDHCMLYVFRCAVYFATESNPKPELLKWWNWKNDPSDK